MKKTRVIAGAVALLASAEFAAAVQQVKSLYTVVDLAACESVVSPSPGGARLCDGLPGYPVFVDWTGLKTYVSVGPDAAKRRAAAQTLAVSNSLFEGNSTRTTVEWRFIVRNGRTVPYATIVRYFTQSPAGRGETLVIMRVTDRETCHVAYVDALANKDAIVLAREIADERARSFDCSAMPITAGILDETPR